MAKNQNPRTEASIKSFPSQFGIAVNRLLWWQEEEEMGEKVLVLTFDNKERLILRNEKQIDELKKFLTL